MDSRSPAALRTADDSLSCKVMRLTKPSLMLNNPVMCAETDLPGTSLNEQHLSDLATLKDTPQFGLSELLTLPQNFGNIFLGETFSSYISVHNDGNQICKDILVKADLQTSSQRLILSGGTNSQPVAQLLPATSIDDVIHHEVKELGTHILVCAVNYTTASGEKMYFRKFFKFQVLKPLDVKTKFYNAEDFVNFSSFLEESDEVYLEAQIQNITPGPIYMEKVSLEPSQLYNSQELNTIDPKEKDKMVFGEVNYMNPLDTRQYLYCLTPKSELYVDNKIVKGVTNIGKMDIVWKTNMGEKGRLQTSALQRVAPGFGDIRLVVDSLPDAVQLESTFNVDFKVINCCERTMDLVVSLHNQPKRGLQWAGISGTQLGRLSPNGSIDLNLSMIPVAPGLHAISGLRFTDTFLKRTYEHDDISHVFVYSNSLE